jgi:Ca2+-binding RTX toxin-like protein
VSAGDGNDIVVGYTGPDILSGGKGYDRFMYLSATDSHGSKVDRVTDFQAKYDQFDFNPIDANTLKNKDQALHFIGAHHFSGKPGELRFEFQHGDTIVLGNTDHDHHAELEVRVEGHISLHADDFIL